MTLLREATDAPPPSGPRRPGPPGPGGPRRPRPSPSVTEHAPRFLCPLPTGLTLSLAAGTWKPRVTRHLLSWACGPSCGVTGPVAVLVLIPKEPARSFPWRLHGRAPSGLRNSHQGSAGRPAEAGLWPLVPAPCAQTPRAQRSLWTSSSGGTEAVPGVLNGGGLAHGVVGESGRLPGPSGEVG